MHRRAQDVAAGAVHYRGEGERKRMFIVEQIMYGYIIFNLVTTNTTGALHHRGQ